MNNYFYKTIQSFSNKESLLFKCRIVSTLLLFFWASSIEAQVYTLNATTNGTTVSTCSGTFYDSGGASSNYNNDEDNVMTFCSATAGQFMRLTFTSFSLEANLDFIQIYDGNSVISPLIGTYSATAPTTITASGTCLTVRFVSNSSTSQSGWSATVSCATSAGVNPTCSDFGILVVNYANNTLTRYDGATGTYLNTVATATQGLAAPNFMYQLPNGTLLVPNGSGNNVIKLNPYTGQSLGVFATGLSFPEQIKLGPDGNLYLANQSGGNLKKYDFNGTLLATITNVNFSSPQGIGFDVGGNMFVSNNVSGGKINKYTTAGVFISTLFTYPVGETPRGIAMLGNDLYLTVKTGTGARVDKFTNSTGAPTTFLTMDANSAPYAGIVWGPDGRLYIADYGESEVQIYNSNGTVYRTITASLSGCHGIAFSGCTPLSVRPPIVVSTLCNAATATITSNVVGGIQPYTYAWSTGATTPSVSGLTGGTYYLTVTDWNKVVVIDTVVVDCICPTITVSAQPTPSVTECIGGTTTLNVTASDGYPPLTYLWESSPNGSNSWTTVGTNSATYTPPSTTAGTTYYRVSMRSTGTSCPLTISTNAAVTIVNDPSVNVTIPPAVVCNGATITLTATPTIPLGSCTVQWQSNNGGSTWSNIAGATGNTYTVSGLSATNGYRAQLVSCTGNGCCN
jgi:CUB domain